MFTRMFVRSFFMQAGWNYERFQNLGFAFCLQPALERIYRDKEKLRDALLRHLQLFNTQPYMASFVAGNVARMEEKAASGGPMDDKAMSGVKQALASSFASIGDRVFWGRLKPMTAQVCLLVWSAGGFSGWLFTGMNSPVSTALLLAGPLSGIILYSAFSVYWRWRGLKKGYECGGAAACGLDSANWPRLIRRLSAAGFAMSLAIMLLSFGMLLALNGVNASPVEVLLKAALAGAVLALHRVLRAMGRSVFFAAGLLLAVSLLLFTVLRLPEFLFL